MVREVVGSLRHIRSLVNLLFDRLERMDGYRDRLTQLFSPVFLPTVLARELEFAKRRGYGFSLMRVDINGLKQVNEANGRPQGDQLLQRVATVLSAQVRTTDFVFRYGGPSFLVLLIDLDADNSVKVAEKLRPKLLALGGGGTGVSLSMGIATSEGLTEHQQLTARVDAALLQSKALGVNRVFVAQAPVGVG
jgi:diguanylate cyclase